MLNHRIRYFLRTVAVATLVAYIPTNLDFSYAASGSFPLEVTIPSSFKIDQNLAVGLPAELGRVESFQPGHKGTILHLQTAHGHYEAQEKIEKLLTWLTEKHGYFPLFLEGASDELNLSRLEFFQGQPELNFQNARWLAKKALVTGTELFLLQNKKAKGYGIETESAYRENHDQFVSVLKAKKDSERFFELFKIEMEKSAAQFSPQLRSFLKRLEQQTLGIVPMDVWLPELHRAAVKHLNLNLAEAAWQVRWPMLVRFFKIEAMSSKLDASKFDGQKENFLTEIKKYLPDAKGRSPHADLFPRVTMLLNSMHQSTQLPEPETENAFIEMLRYLPAEFDFEQYPQVTNFVGLLVLRSQLNLASLGEEITRLEELIADRLAVHENEKQLLAIFADYRLLEKTLALQLTPGDFEKIQNRLQAPRAEAKTKPEIYPSSIAQRLNFNPGHLADLDRVFDTAIAFYRGARERDQVMIQKTEEYLKKQPAALAVVVTGGFHTEPMRAQFEKEGYAYAVVTPAISDLDETGYQAYLKAMLATAPSQPTTPNQMIELALGSGRALGGPTQERRVALTVRRVRAQKELPLLLKDRIAKPIGDSQVSPKLLPEGAVSHPISLKAAPTPISPDSQMAVFEPVGRSEARQRVPVIGKGLSGEEELEASIEPQFVSDEPDVDLFTSLLSQNGVLYLSPSPDASGDYDLYHAKLNGLAMSLGNALRTARDNGDQRRKVIVLRGLLSPGITAEVYNTIKWNANPRSGEDLNFEVVFQPDFSIPDENGSYQEEHLVFGQLNHLVDEHTDLGKRETTQAILRGLYPGKALQFMDDKSAELSKEMLLIYLGAKLAHFDDVAELSRRYGADLSVAALGAGLDKRIRTLFTNPSLGFGSRLFNYLRWIRAARLSEAVSSWEGAQTLRGSEEEKNKSKREAIEKILSEALKDIESGHRSQEDVIRELPRSLHMLFLIDSVLQVNKQNILDFYDIVTHEYKKVYRNRDLRGKKVTLLSVGDKSKSNLVSASPALILIDRFVKDGVTEFYIADTGARESFQSWVTEKRQTNSQYRAVRFYGIEAEDEPYSLENGRFYDAVEQGDLTIIATDSNPDLKVMDLKVLSQKLDGKILFDGMNLFGLRADGTHQYQLDAAREAGINLVGVGRISMGPRFDDADGVHYHLSDSAYVEVNPEDEQAALARYDRMILDRGGDFDEAPEKVVVVGGGYVGLTTAANLARWHEVHVVDIPAKKREMEALQGTATETPIYEPGLQEMIIAGKEKGHLNFSVDKESAIAEASVVYLAVGTPSQDSGEVDLSYILQATRDIGAVILKHRSKPKTIVVKSTVTPHTFEEMDRVLREQGLSLGKDYALVSNPEFLAEGRAVIDVTQPDRTVLGFYAAMTPEQRKPFEVTMLKLWRPLMQSHPHQFLLTDTASSTIIKYLANSWLAISITLSNLFAEEADKQSADFAKVREPFFADPRIGSNAFLWPACGYGGSCFPKDVKALAFSSSESTGHALPMINIATTFNDFFKTDTVRRALEMTTEYVDAAEPLAGKKVAMLGMAFKANTDDMREASSVTILYELLKRGAAQVRLHDPIFSIPGAPSKEIIIDHFLDYLYKSFSTDSDFLKSFGEYKSKEMTFGKTISDGLRLASSKQDDFKERLLFFKEIYFPAMFLDTQEVVFDSDIESLGPSDLVMLVTEWPQYKEVDLNQFKKPNQRLAVLDGRNLLYSRIPEILAQEITYAGIGARGAVLDAQRNSNQVRSEVRGQTSLVELNNRDRFLELLQSGHLDGKKVKIVLHGQTKPKNPILEQLYRQYGPEFEGALDTKFSYPDGHGRKTHLFFKNRGDRQGISLGFVSKVFVPSSVLSKRSEARKYPQVFGSESRIPTEEEALAANAVIRHFSERVESLPHNAILAVLGNPTPDYPRQVVELMKAMRPQAVFIVGHGGLDQSGNQVKDPEYKRIKNEVLQHLEQEDLLDEWSGRILTSENDRSMNTGQNVGVVAEMIARERAALEERGISTEKIVLTQMPAGMLLSRRIFEYQWNKNAEAHGIADLNPQFISYAAAQPEVKAGEPLSQEAEDILKFIVLGPQGDGKGQVWRLKEWHQGEKPLIRLHAEDHLPETALESVRGFLLRPEPRLMSPIEVFKDQLMLERANNSSALLSKTFGGIIGFVVGGILFAALGLGSAAVVGAMLGMIAGFFGVALVFGDVIFTEYFDGLERLLDEQPSDARIFALKARQVEIETGAYQSLVPSSLNEAALGAIEYALSRSEAQKEFAESAWEQLQASQPKWGRVLVQFSDGVDGAAYARAGIKKEFFNGLSDGVRGVYVSVKTRDAWDPEFSFDSYDIRLKLGFWTWAQTLFYRPLRAQIIERIKSNFKNQIEDDVQAYSGALRFEYTTQKGQTLFNLADLFETTTDEISKTNGWKNPHRELTVGEKVVITTTANSFRYVVGEGETLYSVAEKLKMTVDALADQNGLNVHEDFRTGMVLTIARSEAREVSAPQTLITWMDLEAKLRAEGKVPVAADLDPRAKWVLIRVYAGQEKIEGIVTARNQAGIPLNINDGFSVLVSGGGVKTVTYTQIQFLSELPSIRFISSPDAMTTMEEALAAVRSETREFDDLSDVSRLHAISQAVQDDLIHPNDSSFALIPNFGQAIDFEKIPDGYAVGVDIGGTNFRFRVIQKQNGKIKDVYMTPSIKIPDEVKNAPNTEQFFDFYAEEIRKVFEQDSDLLLQFKGRIIPLGFTFSFEVNQTAIDRGVIGSVSKGFVVEGLIGKDAVEEFQAALNRKLSDLNINFQVNVLLNDTTATALAASGTSLGLILGTGFNIAALLPEQEIEKIAALRGMTPDQVREMFVNLEAGNTGKQGWIKEYRSRADEIVDGQSENAGDHLFEKMVSGAYLGQIVAARLLLELGALGWDLPETITSLKITAPQLGQFLDVRSNQGDVAAAEFALNEWGIPISRNQTSWVESLIQSVLDRSAALVAANIAGIISSIDPELENIQRIAVDGSVYLKSGSYQQTLRSYLEKILGAGKASRIELVPAPDGSSRGAALLAAQIGIARSEQRSQPSPSEVFVAPQAEYRGALEAARAKLLVWLGGIVPQRWLSALGFKDTAIQVQQLAGMRVFAEEVPMVRSSVLAVNHAGQTYVAKSETAKSSAKIVLDQQFIEEFLNSENASGLFALLQHAEGLIVFDAEGNLSQRITDKLNNRRSGLSVQQKQNAAEFLKALRIVRGQTETIYSEISALAQKPDTAVLLASADALEKVNGELVMALRETVHTGDAQALVALIRVLKQAAMLDRGAASDYLQRQIDGLRRQGRGWLADSIQTLISSLIANHELVATSA